MKDNTEREYFECQCSYPTHQVKFEYSPDENELTVWLQCRVWEGFFARLRKAFRYVIFKEAIDYDASIIRVDDIERMKRIIEKVHPVEETGAPGQIFT